MRLTHRAERCVSRNIPDFEGDESCESDSGIREPAPRGVGIPVPITMRTSSVRRASIMKIGKSGGASGHWTTRAGRSKKVL